MEPGVILPASVTVLNRGHALITTNGEYNQGFVLRPKIIGLNYHAGSLAGGHIISIRGRYLGSLVK